MLGFLNYPLFSLRPELGIIPATYSEGTKVNESLAAVTSQRLQVFIEPDKVIATSQVVANTEKW